MKIDKTDYYKVQEFKKLAPYFSGEPFWVMLKENFKKSYFKEITTVSKFISEFTDGSVYIFVDNDFDGFSSALNMFTLLNFFIETDKIKLIYLDDLHRCKLMPNISNKDLLVITDTALGNINVYDYKYVIWLDHHEVKWSNSIRARNNYICYINAIENKNSLIQNLSCGLFTYLFCIAILDSLNINSEDIAKLQQSYDSKCKQDSILSLISDGSELNNYLSLINDLFYMVKTPLFTNMMGGFDYCNSKYIRKYIAYINNALRMRRNDLLTSVITSTSDISADLIRIDSDKKALLSEYLRPLSSTVTEITDQYILKVYAVPKIDMLRSFKGLLASINIPTNKIPYCIFSYFEDNDNCQFSCRTNIEGLLNILKQSGSKFIGIGGHKKAFGFAFNKKYLNNFLNNLKKVIEISLKEDEDKIENELVTISSYSDVLDIALYNEYYGSDVAVIFSDEDYDIINVEMGMKRTVYTISSFKNKRFEVISFDVGQKKSVLVGIPRIKFNTVSSDQMDILERK